MQQSAFLPRGNVIAVTTSGTTLTPLSQLVSFAPPPNTQPAAQASGLDQMPPAVRIVNTSAGIVYVSLTSVARTAAVPVAGTPSLEMPVMPNEDIVFVVPQQPQAPTSTPGVPANPYTISINTIAAGTSAVLMVQFGEGL